jgi:hypothetical protein
MDAGYLAEAVARTRAALESATAAHALLF